MQTTAVPPTSASETRAFGALLVGAVCIGFAPIFAKLSVNHGHVSPVAVGFWRMFFGSLSLSILWRGAFKNISWDKTYLKNSGYLFILPGFCFAGDLSLWHWSFEFTSIANASILANVAAIIVPLIGYFFFRERLGIKFFIGAWVAFLGLVALILFGHQNMPTGRTHGEQMFGDILGFITAFFYSGYLISTKKFVNKYPTALLMIFSSAWAAVFLLIVTLLRGGVLFPDTTLGWIYLVSLGMVSQMAGQGLVAWAMRQLSASVSSVTLLLAPMFSSIFGVFILDQPLSFLQTISAVVVVAGIFYASLQYRKKEK